ncbi:MAG: hypothetical protein RLQ12_17090 [Cyclobacteriaceae bacterium]
MSEKDIKTQQEQEVGDITGLINPFPGLRPFGVEESHLFFGREGQSDEVLTKLSDNRFVAILGSSGSGKSSFMYCGLIPSLNGGFMTDAGSNWKVVVARPGGGPIDNLAESILMRDKTYASLTEEDQMIKKTIIGTVLRSSSLGLVEVIRQLKGDKNQNVLIVIDQFEELFRFRKMESATSDQDESTAFVNLLLEAIHQFDEPIYVTITMRSDFIGECAKFPDLTQMINDSHYLIPQMTRDQKRMAIEGPVAVGGGKISPRLSQQLLNDVGDNPDQLPIMQHALMSTWSYWTENRKPDEPIDLRHYNAIGTLKEALSQHANEAYDNLSKREKEICEVMFKALTERGSENQGIRRPTKLGTIASISGVSEDEVVRVVDKFREPGRSLLMPPHGVRLESDTVIDISHESLMRIWDRLKRWLDEESRAAEMYMKLAEAAERYQEGRASLWKMPDLQLAINWKEENNPTIVWGQRYNPAFERSMVFLETSIRAWETEQRNKELLQKRKVKFFRITAIVLGGAALVCIFLVVLSYIKAEEATKNSILATQKAEEAAIATNKATEEAANALRAEKEALLSRDSANVARQQAEENFQLAQRQTQLAKQAQAETQVALEDAQVARDQAVDARDSAEVARQQAVIAQQEAERLRYQSIAQSMAIKSQTIKRPGLQGAVAKQGYDFHMEFKDPHKDYNGDIYAGVFSGLANLLDPENAGEDVFKGDSILNQYHGHPPLMDPRTGRDKQIAVRAVKFSEDGQRMYSVGSDGKLVMWDINDEKRRPELLYWDTETTHINRTLDITEDERYIAIGTDNEGVIIVDRDNLTAEPKVVKNHLGGTVIKLMYLSDNESFISVGTDKLVILNKSTGPQQIFRVDGVPRAMALSPDEKRLAIGTDNGEVVLIDLTSDDYEYTKIARTKQEDNEIINSVEFNHKGNLLAFGIFRPLERSGVVNIFDLDNNEKYGPDLVGFVGQINDIHFSPDDSLIVAASSDHTAQMWDLRNIYDLPTVFPAGTDWVSTLDFHPDGHYFMTGSYDGVIRKFDVLPHNYASRMCDLIPNNMTETEWDQYVGEDIPYKITCEGKEEEEGSNN